MLRQLNVFIITFTMQVYIELSLAENFCMDYFLLYSAKAITKNRCGVLRLTTASVLGACFAVVFPLIPVLGVWAIIIKIIAGLALCAVAGKYSRVAGYFKFTAAFFVLTFILGGALIGIFSLADISYESGGAFLISSTPVGIALFSALLLTLGVRAAARKIISSKSKNTVRCRIYAGQSCVNISGFYDSGNKVYHLGNPVSVIPLKAAEKLTDIGRIKTFAIIHTVAGSKKIAIFTADKMEIYDGKDIKIIKNVKLGISPNPINGAVLHSDLAEDN